MTRFSTVLVAAIAAAIALVGWASGASASYRHHSCCHLGPVAPSYSYNTAHSVRHVTRYRDVSRTNYVYRTKRMVHVTRVRPVIYVHNVTRVHHHTVALVRPVYEHHVQYMRPERVVTNSVVNTYDCGCSARRHHRYGY